MIPHPTPRFGFKLPNCGGVLCEVDWARPSTMLAQAGLAESLGFDSVWLHDHILTPAELQHLEEPPFYEPLIVMGAVASAFPSLVVGVATLILPMRDPVVLAKQIVTLESLYPGRIIIGLGLGQYESEFEAFGLDTYRSRGGVGNEYLDIMRSLLTEPSTTYQGTHRSLREAQAWPKADFPRRPPIWIGGNSDPGLARARKYGAGWIFSGSIGPEEAAARLGPVETDFAVVLTATVVRSDGAATTAEDDGHRIHQHAATISGNATEVAATLQAYVDAGVTDFLLTFRSPTLEVVREQMQWFSENVRPMIRQAVVSRDGAS